MLLNASEDQLMCHQFRSQVLGHINSEAFPDFSIYTISAIAEDYRKRRPELLPFFAECLYIRSGFNPYNRKQKLKMGLLKPFFKQFNISKERQTILRKVSTCEPKLILSLVNSFLN